MRLAAIDDKGVGMATAYYSLIQFCPDLGRQEAFNIGLVVFCPDPHLFQVRLIDGFGAYSRGAFGFDLPLFEAAKHDFRRRLIEAGRSFRQISELASFRASGTNPIRRGSKQGNSRNAESLCWRGFVDFWCNPEPALFEPRPPRH
jgi:hypothetical protein